MWYPLDKHNTSANWPARGSEVAKFPLDNHLSLMPQQVFEKICTSLRIQPPLIRSSQGRFVLTNEFYLSALTHYPYITFSCSSYECIEEQISLHFSLACIFLFDSDIVKMTAGKISFAFIGFGKTILTCILSSAFPANLRSNVQVQIVAWELKKGLRWTQIPTFLKLEFRS